MASSCAWCVHLRRDGSVPQRCDAFPDGIPMEIQTGVDHSEPFEGDRGIRFEEAPLSARVPGA